MPYVNKITVGNDEIDLTSDTLSAANQIAKGIIGHLNTGEVVVGTLEAGADLDGGLVIISHVLADGTQELVMYGNSDEYGYTADSTEVSGGQRLVLTGEEEEGIDIEAIVSARVEQAINELLEEIENGEY